MSTSPETSNIENSELILGPDTLAILGINDPAQLTVLNSWRRSSEIYYTDFLLHKDGVNEHLIAKACIKFGPREAMIEWLERRKILEENGVSTPKLFVIDGATIIEEFISSSFRDAFQIADNAQQEKLKESYIRTYKQIRGVGFSPISLHDLRSHGDDAVVIDFGEDLGGTSQINQCDLSIADTAEKWFLKTIK